MKIVFMGTPAFAVPSLRALKEAGHEIVLVVTQSDKRGNRGKVIPSPVKQLAAEYGIEVAQPVSIRKDEEFMSSLEALEPDLIVVAAFGQILPERVLNIPKYDCINVHGSLLPQLRGASPMQNAILLGLEETGITIMKMAKGLDTGDMISKASLKIDGMDITELSEKLAELGAELLVNTIPSIEDGTAVYEVQNDEEASYARMIDKQDGMTDFNEPADVIERKIRAYSEWPALYSYLDGQQVKFYKAEVTKEKADAEPGTVTDITKNSYSINCSDYKLKIVEQQLQGKKRMSAGDFMRGHKLSDTDRFKMEEEK